MFDICEVLKYQPLKDDFRSLSQKNYKAVILWWVCQKTSNFYQIFLFIVAFKKSHCQIYCYFHVLVIKLTYNLGQNIRRLFDFLAKFVFTTSETELDYYHQKVSARVVERLKTQDLKKLGNFQKIPEMLVFNGKYPAVQLKAKF